MRTISNIRGLRGEALALLFLNGVITQRGLSLIMSGRYNYRSMQRTVKKLVDEDVICKDRVKSDKKITYVYRLTNNLEDIAEDISEVVSEPTFEKYLNYKTCLNRIDSEKRQREIYRYEALSFMIASGLIEDEGFRIKENPIAYYDVKDIKSEMSYQDDYESNQSDVSIDNRQIAFTKAYALLLGKQNKGTYENNYAIYNFGDGKSLFRLSSGEYKIKNYIKEYVRQKKNKSIKLDNALALVSNLQSFTPYILPVKKIKTKTDESNDSRIENFCTVYRSVYILPYNEYGCLMAKLMLEPMWKEDMLLFAFKEVQDTHNMSTVCDYYDEDGKTYYLFFGIPDISRLRQFIRVAENNTDKSTHYKIVCFDYQAPFIKSVAEGICEMAKIKFRLYAEEKGLTWRAGFSEVK